MMKIKSATSLFLVISFLLYALSISAAQVAPSKSIAAISDEFESKIIRLVENEKYIEAIGAAAEYEQALLSKYPTPIFELGLFQSEAHHISFHSSFEGWIEESPKDMPAWLPAAGFDVLVALKGKVKDDTFMLFSLDLGKIEQRLGGEEFVGTELSDQELLMAAQMMAANFGVVKNQEFKTAGEHQILVFEIGTPGPGPSVVLASLAQGRRYYGFLLTSSLGNRTESEKRLYELIKTVDFKYKLPDTAKIEAVREKLTDEADITQILHCVKELALVSEYDATSGELSRLRLVIAERMPKPMIDGNVARYSTYGLTLINPDPEKWKLSIESQGGIGMLILEDRFSVNMAGVAVGVLNTILAYGPQMAEAIGKTEEERKGFLASAGRGGLMNIGADIESERFRMFKGSLAYEGTASTNIPNTKVKGLWIEKPGYIIMVLMFIETSNFNARATEYEALLDECLQLETR